MNKGFQLFPDQASTMAPRVDALFFYELAVALFFTLLIFVLIVYFALRYRRTPTNQIPPPVSGNNALEAAWTLIPFALMLVMFFWGTRLYIDIKRPPRGAMEIHVIGKQWMWKIQHPNGAREINELHVPINRPVKLIMASQDVIHDFSMPAFRIRQDVVPGSYVTQWFTATAPGEYHLFCSEYCGTDHAKMIGRIVVMQPQDYQAWLAGTVPSESPAAAGSRLFVSYGCAVCHGQRAPTLSGLYDHSQRVVVNGRLQSILADDNYLRESILDPSAKLVVGYPPIMPSYRGQLTEDQLLDLVAYIKSLASTHVPPTLGQPATRPIPTTQPLNYPPTGVPNFPPARQPPEFRENIPGSPAP